MMKTRLLFFSLIMALLPLSSVSVYAGNPGIINLEVGYNDPDDPKDANPRSPIFVPHVGIDGFTLTFYDALCVYWMRMILWFIPLSFLQEPPALCCPLTSLVNSRSRLYKKLCVSGDI